MRHRTFFTLTEKVRLEAAGPRVRPFGNFRKLSLELGGKAEANAHVALASQSTSSSRHQLAPGLPHQHQPAWGTGPGLRKEAPLCPRLHHSQGSCFSGSESLIISDILRNTANVLRRAYKVGGRLQKVNVFLFRCFLQLLWYLLQEASLVPHEGPEINKLL